MIKLNKNVIMNVQNDNELIKYLSNNLSKIDFNKLLNLLDNDYSIEIMQNSYQENVPLWFNESDTIIDKVEFDEFKQIILDYLD